MRKTFLVLLGAVAGSGADADRFATPLPVPRRERKGRGRRRHLSAAQPVRRRVRAGARRLCREARRRQAHRIGDQRHARPASIRIRATWTPRASATCRSRPAASSAGSASRSRWRTASSRSSPRSTTRPPPRPASWPTTSSPISTTKPVQGLTLNQAVEKMRGPVNTKIKLKIMRKGQDKPIEVTIMRDIIRVRSVRSRTEGDDVGYIRITPVQRADHRGPQEGARRDHRRSSRPTSSRATSSTCATIRAACSTRRSRSPTPSWRRARSSRPAAATPRRPSASTPAPATSPRASRSSC